jgi:hypothetical protein
MSMSISSSDPLANAASIGATSTAAARPAQGDADGDGDAQGAVKVSPRAQLLAKLQDLEQSDPAQAKQVLSDMATKLRDQAGQATGEDASRLTAMADKLQKAADTGDLSGLGPSKGAHHGHHHGGGKARGVRQAYASAAQPGQDLLSTLSSELAAVDPTKPATSTSPATA